jgi:hypothetical protein
VGLFVLEAIAVLLLDLIHVPLRILVDNIRITDPHNGEIMITVRNTQIEIVVVTGKLPLVPQVELL